MARAEIQARRRLPPDVRAALQREQPLLALALQDTVLAVPGLAWARAALPVRRIPFWFFYGGIFMNGSDEPCVVETARPSCQVYLQEIEFKVQPAWPAKSFSYTPLFLTRSHPPKVERSAGK